MCIFEALYEAPVLHFWSPFSKWSSSEVFSLSGAKAENLGGSSTAGCCLPHHRLPQTIALAGEYHYVRMMHQPIDQRRRKAVVAKKCVPSGKLQIGSDDEALSLVAFGDHLEHQLSNIIVQRYKAKLMVRACGHNPGQDNGPGLCPQAPIT